MLLQLLLPLAAGERDFILENKQDVCFDWKHKCFLFREGDEILLCETI